MVSIAGKFDINLSIAIKQFFSLYVPFFQLIRQMHHASLRLRRKITFETTWGTKLCADDFFLMKFVDGKFKNFVVKQRIGSCYF